jgi:hypothetical protein
MTARAAKREILGALGHQTKLGYLTRWFDSEESAPAPCFRDLRGLPACQASSGILGLANRSLVMFDRRYVPRPTVDLPSAAKRSSCLANPSRTRADRTKLFCELPLMRRRAATSILLEIEEEQDARWHDIHM